MREIKFRAWCDSEMWEAWKIEWYKGIPIAVSLSYPPSNRYWFKSIDAELKLMQYTGLKDKYDKEIYEGDWLKIDGILQEDFITTVKWDTGAFTANKSNITAEGIYYNHANLAHWAKEGVEVIGNIYENPELFK